MDRTVSDRRRRHEAAKRALERSFADHHKEEAGCENCEICKMVVEWGGADDETAARGSSSSRVRSRSPRGSHVVGWGRKNGYEHAEFASEKAQRR